MTDTQNKITDVKTAFSSWDNCMKASFCKYEPQNPLFSESHLRYNLTDHDLGGRSLPSSSSVASSLRPSYGALSDAAVVGCHAAAAVFNV